MRFNVNTSNIYIIASCSYWFIASLTFPILTLHFLEQGISIKEIGFAASVSAVIYVLLDIPLGAISDRVAKRYIFSISSLLHALGYIIWTIDSGIVTVVLAYSVWGAGRAFYSGALEAWFVNTIDSDNRSTITNKAFNYSSIGTSLAIACGVLVTGYLSQISESSLANYDTILKCAAIGMILLGVFGFSFMTEIVNKKSNKRKNQKTNTPTLCSQISHAIVVLRNIRFSRYLFLSFAYGLCFGFFEVFWMPLGIDLNMAEFEVTVAYASAYLASSITLILLIRVKVKSNYEYWIPIVRSAFAISFLALSFTTSYIGFIISMLLIYVLSFIEAPMIQTGLNEVIEDKSRALMLSCDSVVKQGVGIISGLLGAWVYETHGHQTILMAISFLTLLSVVPYVYAQRCAKRELYYTEN
ncbi:MFS transporter [Vibrio cholerae]|uniref:MFS transporter n=1 Tax=Vibrio cholerae TaxID=666 RepID=UPI000BA9B9C6|nr:MFS transporter [Vibrio cholerae]PAS27430.1 hypothetical protein CGT71_18090 [Vibrio cholerae]